MAHETGNIGSRLREALRHSNATQRSNTLLNFAERSLGRAKLLSLPSIVQVEVTNRCNLNCIFCSRHSHPLQLGDLPECLIPEISNFSARARETICFGYGEPLIGKTFRGLIRDTRSGRISFTTNGLALTPALISELLAEVSRPLYNITFSIDALDEATYLSIREHSNFERVWENLRGLAALKASRDLTLPEIWINFVAMRRNIEQLPGLLISAAEAGVSRILVFHLVVWDASYQAESLLGYPDLTKRIFDETRRIAGERGIRVDLPITISDGGSRTPDDPEAMPLPKCHQPWSYVYIRHDGEVHACCFSERLKMGDLKENRFDEIWNNAAYQNLRQTVNTSPPPDCLRCEMRFRYSRSPNERETYLKLTPRAK